MGSLFLVCIPVLIWKHSNLNDNRVAYNCSSFFLLSPSKRQSEPWYFILFLFHYLRSLCFTGLVHLVPLTISFHHFLTITRLVSAVSIQLLRYLWEGRLKRCHSTAPLKDRKPAEGATDALSTRIHHRNNNNSAILFRWADRRPESPPLWNASPSVYGNEQNFLLAQVTVLKKWCCFYYHGRMVIETGLLYGCLKNDYFQIL